MKTNYRNPCFLIVTIFIFFAGGALAGSGTWLTTPVSGDWNSAPNWSPMTVPNGPADTATFGSSSVTNISLSANTEVNGIVFSPGASAFTINSRPVEPDFQFLTIGGAGIINNSGVTQDFVTAVSNLGYSAAIVFRNNATAGNMTVFNYNGDSSGTLFRDNSNAGSATLNHNPSDGLLGAATVFHENSSAGSATINLYGPTDRFDAGSAVFFADNSTAGNATIAAYGSTTSEPISPSTIRFDEASSAGNATLIALGGSGESPGGRILLLGNSSGGTARIEVFGNGVLFADGKTIGSLEGTGNASSYLTVGSNNLSTIFSGTIFGGGFLTKIGTGTLVLSGANEYAGGTTVNGGLLQVDNTSGSGTGTGPVTVNSGGKLGGTGTIAGNVTNNGIVSPGDSPGTLHVGGNYFQTNGGTLQIEIASLFSFDQLMVSGTAALDGTLVVSLDGYTGHAGDSFTILTSSGLSGNFLNLGLPELSNGLFFTERIASNDVLLTVSGSTGVPDQGSTLWLMAGALVVLFGIQRSIISRLRQPGHSPTGIQRQ
jgi:autotransporter-associated beta strand protein